MSYKSYLYKQIDNVITPICDTFNGEDITIYKNPLQEISSFPAVMIQPVDQQFGVEFGKYATQGTEFSYTVTLFDKANKFDSLDLALDELEYWLETKFWGVSGVKFSSYKFIGSAQDSLETIGIQINIKTKFQ